MCLIIPVFHAIVTQSMAQNVSHNSLDTISFQVRYEGKGGTWTTDGNTMFFEEDGSERRWNAWQLREAFFSVKSQEDALSFLNGCGAFGRAVQPIPFEGEEPESPEQATIQTFEEFDRWQYALRLLLSSPPEFWGAPAVVAFDGGQPDLPEAKIWFDEDGHLQAEYGGLFDADKLKDSAFDITTHTQFNFEFKWTVGNEVESVQEYTATGRPSHERRVLKYAPIVGVIRTNTAISALLATIFLDHLRNAEFKVCRNVYCRRPQCRRNRQ